MKRKVLVNFPIVFLIVVVLSFSSIASATPVPTVSIWWSGSGMGSWTSSYVESDLDNPDDGIYTLYDTWSNGSCDASWDLTVQTDPSVNGEIGLTNNLDVTQTFIMTFIVPVSPAITPTSVHGGSTGGTMTDADGDGTAVLSTVADPFYSGRIDGSGVLSIYSDPSSWSVAYAGQTVNILAQNPGLPGPTLPSGPVFSTISIQHKFSLTPHDSIAVTSFFQVEVPEPATLLLFGLGGFALLRKRRA